MRVFTRRLQEITAVGRRRLWGLFVVLPVLKCWITSRIDHLGSHLGTCLPLHDWWRIDAECHEDRERSIWPGLAWPSPNLAETLTRTVPAKRRPHLIILSGFMYFMHCYNFFSRARTLVHLKVRALLHKLLKSSHQFSITTDFFFWLTELRRHFVIALSHHSTCNTHFWVVG